MHSKLYKKLLGSFLLLPILTGLSGCVTTSDVNSMRMELRQTRTQLNAKIENVNKEMVRSDTDIRNQIKKSNDPMQSRQANLWAELNSLKQQVAILQGNVDELSAAKGLPTKDSANRTAAIEDISRKINEMRIAIESQLAVDFSSMDKVAKKENLNKTTSPALAPEKTGIEAAVAPKETIKIDPAQALYDKGLNLFKSRKYEDAIRDWAEFTKTFPKHKLVPNAVFWEGECYYQLKDYANAALKYQVIIGKYPKSSKYNSSMLKQGFCLVKLGKTSSGKYILQDLIKKAPKSAEAKRAEAYLKNLK